MEDIYIEKVSLKNCRGHKEMEMDFPTDNFTVIQGKNGSGKSTILKAISMALFGDDGAPSGEKLTITEMVNRKEDKDLEIIVNFRIVNGEITDNYEVQLYYKHKKYKNQMFIKKNGDDISGKSKQDNYQMLENLLYPKEVYHNVVYFSQQVKNFFTSLTNTEQKRIFDSILQIGVYDDYYKNVTKSLKQIIDDIQAVDFEIQRFKQELIFKENRLIELEEEKKQFDKNKSENVLDRKEKIRRNQDDQQIVINQIEEVNFSQEELDQLRSDIIKLEQEIKNSEEKIQNQIDQLDSKQENEFLKIESSLTDSEREKINEIRNKFDEGKQKFLNQRNEISGDISKIYKKFDKSSIEEKHSEVDKKKREELANISFEINNLDSKFSTSMLEFEKEKKLKAAEDEIQKLKDDASDLKVEASNIKSSIDEKEEEIKKDEQFLSKEEPECSKCGRSFDKIEDANQIHDSIKRNNELINKLNNDLDICRKKMEQLKSEYEKCIADKQNLKDEYQDQIDSIISDKKKKLQELKEEQDYINSEIENNNNERQKKISEIELKIDKETEQLQNQLNDIDQQIESINQKSQEEIEKISSEYQKESLNKKSEHNKKYDQLKEELISKNRDDILNLKARFSEKQKDRDSLIQKEKRIKELKETKISLDYRLEALNKELKEITDSEFDQNKIQKIQNEITELNQKLSESEEQFSILENDKEKLEFWREAFSNKGIKSMLIDMAVPHMNEAVSNALEKIAPGVFTVSFDTLKETKTGDIRDKFNVNVLHNIKGTDSHKMLSGGEKRLVDLACMKSLGSLSEKLYNKKIHNLFYDEVLDSLDGDNRQIFCQASKSLTHDINTTLVTHNSAEDSEPDRIFKL